MCTQKPPHDYSQQLYDRYKQEIRKYLLQAVRIPHLVLVVLSVKMILVYAVSVHYTELFINDKYKKHVSGANF